MSNERARNCDLKILSEQFNEGRWVAQVRRPWPLPALRMGSGRATRSSLSKRGAQNLRQTPAGTLRTRCIQDACNNPRELRGSIRPTKLNMRQISAPAERRETAYGKLRSYQTAA